MNLVINVLIVILFFLSPVHAEEDPYKWPREIEEDDVLITIYQPQPELFEKNILEGRMAISVEQGKDSMLFCAAWFKAIMVTDYDERTALLDSLEITKIHFPEVKDENKIAKLSSILEKELSGLGIEMSLDRLAASLGDIVQDRTEDSALKNSPPDIYFRQSPTILITIDGEPIEKKAPESDLSYVVNTPFFIVGAKGGSPYYLKGGGHWYVSEKITKGWSETTDVPGEVVKFAKEYSEHRQSSESEKDGKDEKGDAAPELLVVTIPSELIVTDGKSDYQSIKGSSLLYVKNSESDIIMDVKSQQHFVLLAGRWYSSKTLADGDWSFIEPEELPEEFSSIPEKSPMAVVRASVPGTSEAKDALLEQSIPQTAVIDRKTAKVEVTYDGEPEFKKIDGTAVSFAVNTDKTVLKIKKKFYCVDDGIWFVSDSATGPWVVSDVRPKEVDDLPPSSPVYNTKYVYIYDSTPEYVYVGYYPGYCHSYVYSGVVVYGTGYWYRPWYRYYYYPRPYTWGFGVHYSSRFGWGFSYGFSYGWIGWGFHTYHRPYWGPRGYYHGYRHGYDHGYRHGIRDGYRLGKEDWKRPENFNNINVYANHDSGVIKSKAIERGKAVRDTGQISARVAAAKENNVFVGKDGKVYQRNKDGSWTAKVNRQANPARIETAGRPAVETMKKSQTRPRPSDVSRSQLDRSHVNRSRGNHNYNRSRAAGAVRSRGGGRMRR